MLTVSSLLDEVGLELIAGRATAPMRPIRWVHISELTDPTPWLSGGELLLTTGIQLTTPRAAAPTSCERLVGPQTSPGSGFGTGFEHDAAAQGARATRPSGSSFPLFEVPYEMPFIAITEKAFARLVNEQYEVLQRGIAVQRRLEQLVLEERGLDEVARALSAADRRERRDRSTARGERSLARQFRRDARARRSKAVGAEDRGGATAPERAPRSSRARAARRAGRWRCRSLRTRRGGPRAWLVAVRDAGRWASSSG